MNELNPRINPSIVSETVSMGLSQPDQTSYQTDILQVTSTQIEKQSNGKFTAKSRIKITTDSGEEKSFIITRTNIKGPSDTTGMTKEQILNDVAATAADKILNADKTTKETILLGVRYISPESAVTKVEYREGKHTIHQNVNGETRTFTPPPQDLKQAKRELDQQLTDLTTQKGTISDTSQLATIDNQMAILQKNSKQLDLAIRVNSQWSNDESEKQKHLTNLAPLHPPSTMHIDPRQQALQESLHQQLLSQIDEQPANITELEILEETRANLEVNNPKFKEALHEIATTEKSYKEGIDQLCEFADALENSGDKKLIKFGKKLNSIYKPLTEEIKSFTEEIEKEGGLSSMDAYSPKKFKRYVQTHMNAIGNMTTLDSEFIKLSNTNSNMDKIIKKYFSKGRTFDSYTITPAQRYPRHVLLCKAVCNETKINEEGNNIPNQDNVQKLKSKYETLHTYMQDLGKKFNVYSGRHQDLITLKTTLAKLNALKRLAVEGEGKNRKLVVKNKSITHMSPTPEESTKIANTLINELKNIMGKDSERDKDFHPLLHEEIKELLSSLNNNDTIQKILKDNSFQKIGF